MLLIQSLIFQTPWKTETNPCCLCEILIHWWDYVASHNTALLMHCQLHKSKTRHYLRFRIVCPDVKRKRKIIQIWELFCVTFTENEVCSLWQRFLPKLIYNDIFYTRAFNVKWSLTSTNFNSIFAITKVDLHTVPSKLYIPSFTFGINDSLCIQSRWSKQYFFWGTFA